MPLRPSSVNRPPSAGEPLRPDPGAGSLQRADGQRIAALSVEFIHGIHFAVLDQFGDSSSNLLYRCGYEWGLKEMLRCNEKLREELGGRDLDLWQMDAKFVFDSWWQPLAETGWGACAFDFSRLSRGLAGVELKHGVVALALNGATRPACHLHAGLFAAALSFFERSERHAVEIQCQAAGHTSCKFIVAPGADVDAIETWRQQGVAAADIARRLD